MQHQPWCQNCLSHELGGAQSETPPWGMLHSNCSLGILPWKASSNVPAGDEKGPLVRLCGTVGENKEAELIFLILVKQCTHLCDVQKLKQTRICKASLTCRLLMREY